jgi:hypothetical protein
MSYPLEFGANHAVGEDRRKVDILQQLGFFRQPLAGMPHG